MSQTVRRSSRSNAGKRMAKYVEDDVDEEEEEEAPPPSKRGKKTASKASAPNSQAASAARQAAAEDNAPAAAAPAVAQKAKKKAAKEKPEEEEKRAATYRPCCSHDVQARIDRALSQGAGAAHRLFLIDTKTVRGATAPEGAAQEFTVLGASGNVYTVNIDRKPRCTCPDCRVKGNVCKHILFCFLRVLRCRRDNPVIWQKALLTSEVNNVLSVLASANGAPVDQAALANDRVRSAYAAATGKELAAAPVKKPAAAAAAGEGEEEAGKKKGRPVEGDCPICYEEMQEGREPVCTCNTCGNHCHKDCFKRWGDSKRGQGVRVTCVWCRSPWLDAGSASAAGPSSLRAGVAGAGVGYGAFGTQYLNLAGVSGQPEADLQDLYGENAEWIARRGG